MEKLVLEIEKSGKGYQLHVRLGERRRIYAPEDDLVLLKDIIKVIGEWEE